MESFPSDASFECSVSKEGLKPKWFRNGKELRKDNKYDTISKNGNHTLVIKNVDGKDEGKYLVKFDDVEISANLKVAGNTQIYI